VNTRSESAGRHAGRNVIAPQVARIFAGRIGRGIAAGAGDALQRSRFTDSGLRLGKVGRRFQRLRNEIVER
jgi:hypothetical protein